MEARNNALYETLKFYKDNSKPVHIIFNSGRWINGIILILHEDRLVLQEEKFGEMLVLFERIKDDGVTPRKERE